MKINDALWNELKRAIESGTEKDKNITDITVKFRIKEHSDLRNYLQVNLSQYEH
jgi:hypothetical protein